MLAGLQNVTPDPEVNRILEELVPRIQAVLGQELVGIYLDGSLARGGFDQASDIDFIAVTRDDVTDQQFQSLQEMHASLGKLDFRLAIEIEGFYVPLKALRSLESAGLSCPNIERGLGERLKYVRLGAGWTVHRWILAEYGIALFGTAPSELVEPVTAADLRQAMRQTLEGWVAQILDDPAPLGYAGYLSYTILSLCRILYTLHFGVVGSKADAAAWAQERVDPVWLPVIAAALRTRLGAGRESTPQEIASALAFIRYATAEGEKYGTGEVV
jgi:predicted nucleotidyltransferase